MSIRERLKAQAKNLRDIATQLDAEAAIIVESDGITQSVVQHCQPLSLESATEHVPLCHRTNQPHPLSSCLGCHPEGE